ncbi:GntR family transcriptional regulator [Streptomyces sp. NPDC051907]|uniref:GntR family transcriptional regulator n=1 Tax=Streptomyces sp. NPDC051907 TaxID=3155284 RepID=UPI003434EAD6
MEQMRRTLRSEDVVAKIRSDIADGVYAPGDRLPSPDVLAGELRKLARAVESAYRQLIEDGVLVEGLLEPGVFVADPGTDPAVRDVVRAVHGLHVQLQQLDRRLGELAERVGAVERGLREARREGGGGLGQLL